jgi:hypothetical protein
MTIKIKMLAFGVGTAALAAATPATAQYYGYSGNATQMAANRCAAAVQNRLSYRTSTNIFGLRTASAGRVLSVTRVNPNRNTVRVRGLATSGSGYGPYGVGLYGTLGYQQRADLSFKCDVDYRGYVRDIDINRR